MNIDVAKTDESHYPYKSKKKRIYNKLLKHIVSSHTVFNVIPNKVTVSVFKPLFIYF